MVRRPKEFSIWLVPSGGGRVKKFKLSLRKIVGVSLVSSLLVGGLVFLASDYGRVQLMRASSFFTLQMVTRDRDALRERTDLLERELGELKNVNARVVAYERNLRQRMDDLRATLESATALSFFQADKGKDANNKKASNDIGGLESDCAPGRAGCSAGDDGRAQLSLPPLAFGTGTSSEDMLEGLDQTIQLLKTIPLSYPANGHINSGYGFRISPFEKRLKRHEGIDLAMPHGSEVFATADGRVLAVRRNKTYGLMIDVAHNDRVITRFAHLSHASVREGERVCRGEVIGRVGSSGRSTGPHLHYEVRFDNRTINPERLLALSERLSRVLR